MRYRSQKGQSLAELALVAPLFLMIFWFCFHLARIYLAKLELISLARETAIARSRLNTNVLSGMSDGDCTDLAKNLAGLAGRLDTSNLKVSTAPALNISALWSDSSSSQDDTMDDGKSQDMLNGLMNLVGGSLLGEKVRLSYTMRFSGLAGGIFPDGLVLKEEVVCVADPWKSPVSKLTASITGSQ